ncbi:P1 family peptidase [Bacillus sp. JCM 19041]|uniref:P1 family peptidase n=1 Tax=Bacillus sp. JCM 19041 TaxID=1460637 RepID=UPI0006D0E876
MVLYSDNTTVDNTLSDVAGIIVGHRTLIATSSSGKAIRTGVTAILPQSDNLFYEKVIGASFVLNGFGKTTGLIQLDELGVIESPIMLTNRLFRFNELRKKQTGFIVATRIK